MTISKMYGTAVNLVHFIFDKQRGFDGNRDCGLSAQNWQSKTTNT